jgi:hypothetical protein
MLRFSSRVLALALAAGASSSALASVTLEPIVRRSDTPPGVPGEFFATFAFSNPKIDNAGNIVVDATLDTTAGGTATTANRRVAYYGGPGSLQLLARDGGLAGFPFLPNPNNWTHNTTTNAAGLVQGSTIAPNGRMLISSNLNGPGATTTNNTAFWTGAANSLAVVAQRGFVPATVPGTSGALWNSNLNIGPSQFDVNNAGQVIFNSQLTGGDTVTSGSGQNNSGVWIGSPGNVQMVMRQGQSNVTGLNDIVTGLPDPTLQLGAAPTFGTRLNGNGHVVLPNKLRVGSGITAVSTNDDDVLLTTLGGSLRCIARQGEQAPGMPAGYTFRVGAASPFNPLTFSPLNNAGSLYTLVNLGGLAGAGVDDLVLYRYNGGTWTVVWQINELAPVTGSVVTGSRFASLNLGNTRVNNAETLALAAFLVQDGALETPITAANDDVLYIKPVGQPAQLVVRQGDLMNLPGFPSDAVWQYNASLSGSAFNNLGQYAFSSRFTGTGITNGVNDTAVFIWDPVQGLQLVAKTGEQYGDPLTMAPATQLSIDGRGNGEGGSAGFSDTGWLAIRIGDNIGNQIVYRARVNPPVAACDDIDFNNNGVFPEDQDVADFFEVLAGGTPVNCDPVAGCNDIDFNNNGVFPEDQDVADFFEVLAGGVCP